MIHPDQDELQVLRERAYGPAADIHLDAQALQRLHELEGRGGDREATPTAEADDKQEEKQEEKQDEFPPPAVEEPVPVVGEAGAPRAKTRRAPFRMRRSTFLIALALVALIVVSNAALLLVQRVQADPLQAGASQIARLSEDATYEIPSVFSSAIPGGAGAPAYQDFYGLRTIINGTGPDTDDQCILVYPPESADDPDGKFSGWVFGACATGAFPAAVAFRVGPGLPEQLRDAFPDGTALQFVLDQTGDEIVVFVAE